ncbi:MULTISPECIES: hypothetical protein [Sphingomonadaceae]|uniref:Stability/partitioning determinant n=1 Tax=Sphingobium baderi TaxID=1332080 RepID=A0A0S3F679_9SPHN|nr:MULTISPECIES: hypothetical protein [Sphingomonadaceae]ALR23136.1 hypothetical protein ATN00_21775 [Sphingobium baderi]CDO34759.1 conserved exported hypothetical protein [Novosphingobium sp. KN65.2]
MTKKPIKATPPLAGVTSFAADEDYIAPPPKEVREKAKADNGRIGFVSEKPTPSAPASRKKREATFTAQFTIRIREEDRERFDEYAYRNRISKGEAFKRLLDTAEGEGEG